MDGDLSDGNLSGRCRSSGEPPFAENYYLEAAMMYDDWQLYIAAHVGDPPSRAGTFSRPPPGARRFILETRRTGLQARPVDIEIEIVIVIRLR